MFSLAWESSETMPSFRFAGDTLQLNLTIRDRFKVHNGNPGVILDLKLVYLKLGAMRCSQSFHLPLTWLPRSLAISVVLVLHESKLVLVRGRLNRNGSLP